MRLVGKFHGVRIYESNYLGNGYGSAGLALPGIGIFVGTGCYSEQKDIELVAHEYGHKLQADLVGFFRFYLIIGLSSLISAWRNGPKHQHQNHWTETWANHLVNQRFPDQPIGQRRFPPVDLDHPRYEWMLGLHRDSTA